MLKISCSSVGEKALGAQIGCNESLSSGRGQILCQQQVVCQGVEETLRRWLQGQQASPKAFFVQMRTLPLPQSSLLP